MVQIPSSAAARVIRTAISPRLAMSRRCIVMVRVYGEQVCLTIRPCARLKCSGLSWFAQKLINERRAAYRLIRRRGDERGRRLRTNANPDWSRAAVLLARRLRLWGGGG